MDEHFLILRLKQKDKVVFDFIFTYYYSGLCVYAKQFTGSSEASEDIVQDFFLNLWDKASMLQISDSLRAYLFSSVRNRCLDYVRHNKVKARYEGFIINEAESLENDNFSLFIESELREAIDKSLEKLPPRCREVFTMSRYEGKSNQQIADQLGLSKRTVELQISNALRMLRTELRPYLPLIVVLLRMK